MLSMAATPVLAGGKSAGDYADPAAFYVAMEQAVCEAKGKNDNAYRDFFNKDERSRQYYERMKRDSQENIDFIAYCNYFDFGEQVSKTRSREVDDGVYAVFTQKSVGGGYMLIPNTLILEKDGRLWFKVPDEQEKELLVRRR